jgi:succinoglycan biosynthesis transport protein ExoP
MCMTIQSIALRAEDDALTLQTIFAFARRRRGVLIGSVVIGLVLAILTCLFATPRYRAVCEVQVQKESGGSFGLENTVTGQVEAANGDSLDYAMTLQTAAAVLRSPALAAAVIESQHLEQTADYFAPSAGAGWAAKWTVRLPWRKPLEPLSVPLSRAPNRRYVAEKIFAAHLKVQPLPGTRLIDVSYTDRDPGRAANVANAIAGTLAELTFQQQMAATLQGSSWLAGQMNELKTGAEQAQARAAALERGTGMYGSDDSRNVVLERLDSLNQTLTSAESNRILKESIDRVAANGSPELISSLSGNSSSGSVASVNTSLTLIQGLRQQEAQTRAELAEDSVRYGPAYPKIGELKAQLAGIDGSIAAETGRLGQRAHTDWQIALKEEQSARAAFEEQKKLASRQNDSVIAYEMARQESASSRDLYEGILAKLKQASLLEGLRANNVSIVSAAEVPPGNHPSSPNIPVRLGAGLAAGLLIGLGAASFTELNDTSIQSAAQIEGLFGGPLLAVLPAIQQSSGRVLPGGRRVRLKNGNESRCKMLGPPRSAAPLPVLEQRLSIFSEGLRSLRTSLQIARNGEPPRVILVTSCVAGEGKTTLAVNLAALLAQGGARVLLVDADLRRPALHVYAKDAARAGLAMALSGPAVVPPGLMVDALPNLLLLAGDEVPPFPADLLGSRRMQELVAQWKTEYDMIVLDAPPVLPVTDAVLLSRLCDATLLVARHRRTTHQALRRGVEVLQQQEARAPIGIVLNDVAQGTVEFAEYFGHQGDVYARHDARGPA